MCDINDQLLDELINIVSQIREEKETYYHYLDKYVEQEMKGEKS